MPFETTEGTRACMHYFKRLVVCTSPEVRLRPDQVENIPTDLL